MNSRLPCATKYGPKWKPPVGGWVAGRKSICRTLPVAGFATGLLGISIASPVTMAITAIRPTASDRVWPRDSRHVGRWNVGRWNAGIAIFGGCQVGAGRRLRGWAPGLGSGAGAGCSRTPCGRLRRLALERVDDGSTRSGCARRPVGASLETCCEAAASAGSCLSRRGSTRGSLMRWCLPLPFRRPDSCPWRPLPVASSHESGCRRLRASPAKRRS